MRNNLKRSLYENIMRTVSNTLKREINESSIASDVDSDIYDGLEYILSDEEMNDYYNRANINNFIPTIKVCTMCIVGRDLYYNPVFIKKLSPVEKAFVILHNCVHIVKNHSANNIEENIALDKEVNNFLEHNFPDFRGITRRLRGIY